MMHRVLHCWTSAVMFLFFSLSATVGQAPDWWATRGVLDSAAPADDFAALNQGQLKHLAHQAFLEMEATLAGGAGAEVTNLVTEWLAPPPSSDDYAVMTVGQLKAVAKPFYDRLIAARLQTVYPWTQPSEDDDDFAAANIGQAKRVFGVALDDIDGDGLSASEEAFLGTSPTLFDTDGNGVPDGDEDSDNDGYASRSELRAGSNPLSGYATPADPTGAPPPAPNPPFELSWDVPWKSANENGVLSNEGDWFGSYSVYDDLGRWRAFGGGLSDKRQFDAAKAEPAFPPDSLMEPAWRFPLEAGSVLDSVSNYKAENRDDQGELIGHIIMRYWGISRTRLKATVPGTNTSVILPAGKEIICQRVRMKRLYGAADPIVQDLGKIVVTIPANSDRSQPVAVDPREQDNASISTQIIPLLPVEMMVDGNRDGEMDFANASIHDKDQTTAQKPYRFWLNDDSDGILDGEETEGGAPDYADTYLKSLRDLEDFTRLWINFKGITEMVKTGGVTVQLEWKPMAGGTSWPSDAGTPAINVFKAVETDGGNQYLSSEAIAKSQVSYGNTPSEYSISLGRVGRGQPLPLPASLLSTLSESQTNKFLLFEGAGEGKGQLVLTLHESGQKIVEYPPVHLHITNVRKMYERAKVTSTPDPIAPPSDTAYPASDPPEPTMGWAQDPTGNPPDYSPASWQESKQYIVLVHGWNMTYLGSQNYAETMFKRLWQRGYSGRFARLYWPTLVGLFTYNDSEYRAWKSGESLKQFMASLPSGYTKNLVSHSMGGIVCGSALQRGMSVTNYALCHAAVPAACYDDSSTLDQGWGYTTPHYDPDQGTRNLSYRYKLNSADGNLVSFFLPLDSALKAWELNNYTSGPGSLGAKPQRYNLGTTGYYYNPVAPAGQRLGINFQTAIGRFVNTPHEAMAYVAQSPTKTVGADGRTAGSIDGSVDLSGYGFDDVHSAEYQYTTQKTKPFFNRLLEEFGLPFIP